MNLLRTATTKIYKKLNGNENESPGNQDIKPNVLSLKPYQKLSNSFNVIVNLIVPSTETFN